MLDLVILLCLWLGNVKVWPIVIIFENYVDPANIDPMSADVLIDSIAYTFGVSVQIFLRLYLKCIKKIQDSDTELISIKVWIIQLSMYISFSLFVYEKWDGMENLNNILQFCVIPIIILFNHSGFNNYYMNNHPKVQDASNAVWHILSVCYFQVID